MSIQSIIEDIKRTGWLIRDWISPFYTLGGAIAFAIAMLTLLDKDGNLHLTRYVGAALLIATFLAWAHHFYQQHKSKATDSKGETTKPTLHVGLLIVSGFFLVGIVLSEALLHEHRQQVQSPKLEPKTISTQDSDPKETSTAPSAPETDAPAGQPEDAKRDPQPEQPAAPAIKSDTTPVAPIVQLPPATPPSQPKIVDSKAKIENPSENKTKKINNSSEKNETRSATNNSQCIELMRRFSSGEDLTLQQRKYFEECK